LKEGDSTGDSGWLGTTLVAVNLAPRVARITVDILYADQLLVICHIVDLAVW